MLAQLETSKNHDPDSMPVEQARLFIRRYLVPLSGWETVGLQDAYLRTLACDVLSPMNVPPHDYSAMDGYAVRHADLQGDATELKICGCSHFIGLPSNPVAVMVTFRQFVSDALRILMGQRPKPAFTFEAVCTDRIKKAPGRTEFRRGILKQVENGALLVRTTGEQGLGIFSSMSRANCFIVLPESQGNAEAGSSVDVQLFQAAGNSA